MTLTQAAACGVSPDVVQRRAADGGWTRLHPAVYLVGGHLLTDSARIWAASLWGGPRAAVSGCWAVPLRFTWHDLVNRPMAVAAEIRAALTTA